SPSVLCVAALSNHACSKATSREGRSAPAAASSTTWTRRSRSERSSRRGIGRWVSPGGYVDRGEPLHVAAVREAREECGLEVRLDGLVNIYSYAGRTPVIVVYAATPIGGTLCADDECLETAEFDTLAIPWTELAFRSTYDGLRD